jgi:hypothetical protein
MLLGPKIGEISKLVLAKVVLDSDNTLGYEF